MWLRVTGACSCRRCEPALVTFFAGRWLVISRADAQSFDRVAEDYDRLGELVGDNRVGRWLSGVLPVSGGRALDLGCGAGRHAVTLAERFEQVDAIDLSGPMIELARARRPRPNIAYRQADLHDIDGTGRYDFILKRAHPAPRAGPARRAVPHQDPAGPRRAGRDDGPVLLRVGRCSAMDAAMDAARS